MKSRSLLAAAVACAAVMSTDWAIVADEQPGGMLDDAALISLLKPGISEKDVEEILRKHGRARWVHESSSEFDRTRYPMNDESSLIVNFEKDRLISVNMARLQELEKFVQPDLVPAVKLIHQCRFIGEDYEPSRLIRAVNGLVPLGKKMSLAALREYHRIAAEERGPEFIELQFRQRLNADRIFLLTRLLFERNDGERGMPRMVLGALGGISHEPTVEQMPLFPLAVVDDVPFFLGTGYVLYGSAQSPLEHIEFCEERCDIRKSPLTPTRSPLDCMEKLESSPEWKQLFVDRAGGDEIAKLEVRSQAVRCVAHLQTNASENFGHCLSPICVGEKKADEYWRRLVREFSSATVQWNSQTQQFVRR